MIGTGGKGGPAKKRLCGVVVFGAIGHLATFAFPVMNGVRVRLSGTLVFRSIEAVALENGWTAYVRHPRLGTMLETIQVPEVALWVRRKRRWFFTVDCRAEVEGHFVKRFQIFGRVRG